MKAAIKDEATTKTQEDAKEVKEEKCDKCLEVKLDFIKWIFGVLVLGATGQLISWSHNQNQLELQKHETDSQLITSISAKFDTLPTVQLSYLKFIAPFVTSGDLKVGVNRSIDSLSRLSVPRYIAKKAKSDASRSAKAAEPKLTASEISKFKTAAASDTNLVAKTPTTPMKKVVEQEHDIIAGNTNGIKSIDSEVIKTIQDGANLLTPSKLDNYEIQGNPVTLWCKKGYYVVFNGTLSIGINNLDIDNQKINIIAKNYVEDKQLDLKELTVGNTVTLDDGLYRYSITLNNIGAAGFNPFTKAAYITVASYKKSSQ